MAGWLALAGGAEFRPGCEEADRRLIDAVGGTAVRVAILPTAAAYEGSAAMAAANGVRYFERLGARAEGVLVVNQETANDEALAAQLAMAQVIYIAGGNPGYLLSTLRLSRTWGGD